MHLYLKSICLDHKKDHLANHFYKNDLRILTNAKLIYNLNDIQIDYLLRYSIPGLITQTTQQSWNELILNSLLIRFNLLPTSNEMASGLAQSGSSHMLLRCSSFGAFKFAISAIANGSRTKPAIISTIYTGKVAQNYL